MSTATGREIVRAVLGFLMLLLIGPACGGSLRLPADGAPPDTAAPNCANVGCAAPPLCSAGCQAACGCCLCTPGSRNGSLVCTDQGCYEPLAAVCALPFDPGPCRADIPVYASVGGACVPRTYGGCEGNDNRFSTLEECLAACEGRPDPNGCPAGRIAREICLACGPAGGCGNMATVCALPCDVDAGAAACDAPFNGCFAGVCQVMGCI